MCEKAMRLHPNSPIYYLSYLTTAYRWVGRYDESLAVANQYIERSRKAKYWAGVVGGYASSAMTNIKLGRDNDAQKNVVNLLKIYPKYSLNYLRRTLEYKDPAHLQDILDGMRKAGVPENPPSQ